MSNFQNDTLTQIANDGIDATNAAAAKVASVADESIAKTQAAAAQTEKSIQAGLKQIREAVPVTISRVTTQAEEAARSGIEKARAAGATVAEQTHRVGDKTVEYVRAEPTKALLMAVAAGAAAAVLIGWATRSNSSRY